jgi:hypothetical protein
MRDYVIRGSRHAGVTKAADRNRAGHKPVYRDHPRPRAERLAILIPFHRCKYTSVIIMAYGNPAGRA